MCLYRAQNLSCPHAVTRDGDRGYHRMLPRIQPVDLGDGNVEAGAQAILQALYNVALFFERMRFFDLYVQGQDANRWRCHAAIGRRAAASRRRRAAT